MFISTNTMKFLSFLINIENLLIYGNDNLYNVNISFKITYLEIKKKFIFIFKMIIFILFRFQTDFYSNM